MQLTPAESSDWPLPLPLPLPSASSYRNGRPSPRCATKVPQSHPGLSPFSPRPLVQVDLLKRLDWRLRLDLAREVGPCRDLLFRPPHGPSGPSPHAAAGAAPHGARSVREEWVARMEALCAEIRGRAAALEPHPSSSHTTESAEEEEEEEPITPAPPKRQRVQ